MTLYVGSCGETSERRASFAHQWLAFSYGVAMVGLGLAMVGLGSSLSMLGAARKWHRNSVATHDRRAVERGE